MIRLRYFHRRRNPVTRRPARPGDTVTWYQLKDGCALLEPYLELDTRYQSFERDAAAGYIRLWIDGRELWVDATHFYKLPR